jgi:hypothetical protein
MEYMLIADDDVLSKTLNDELCHGCLTAAIEESRKQAKQFGLSLTAPPWKQVAMTVRMLIYRKDALYMKGIRLSQSFTARKQYQTTPLSGQTSNAAIILVKMDAGLVKYLIKANPYGLAEIASSLDTLQQTTNNSCRGHA